MRLTGFRRLGLWWVIAVFVVAGVALIVFASRLRLGGFVIGVGLLIAAALRLLVNEPHGGGIEVRTRIRDVITLVVAAGLVFGRRFP